MHNIAVLDYRLLPDIQKLIQDLASNEIEFPKQRCKEEDRIAKTGNADIVLVTPWEKIDKEYLDACPKLKYVGLCGTSTANIDLQELSERGIAFSNIVSGDKESVAEFFFMQLVLLMRGVGDYQWKAGEAHELVDRSVGIIGLGAVGQAIAHMALAHKMHVYYYSPHRKQKWEDRGLVYKDKNELLGSSEIVVLCSPTNIEVLGKAEFRAMQPGSILVQACGGNPFDKPAFRNWITQDGNYGIFDMSANEKNYLAYKDLPRVIFSREVAGDTYESNQRRGQRALQNLKNFLEKSNALFKDG
jgi:phosphoglycerate dehydrogenase-like enzyme